MLSFQRAVSVGLGLVLLGASSVSADAVTGTSNTVPTGSNAMVLGNSVVDVAFTTGDEYLYFSGDGSSDTKPLVGILVDYDAGQGVDSTTPQAELNGLFEFVHSYQGSNAICCYPAATCTPTTGNKFSIQANVDPLLPNVVTPIQCKNGAHTQAWVLLENVYTISGQIQGVLSWVIDGPAPAQAAQYDNDVTPPVLISPAVPAVDFVVAPVLSQLAINQAVITGAVDYNGNAVGPTGWVQAASPVPGSTDGSEDGAQVDAVTGYISWTSNVADPSQLQDTTTLLDVIGCSVKFPGDSTYTTVNDKTHWPAPAVNTDGNGNPVYTPPIHYTPTCYFKAVDLNNNPQTVSVSVDVAVMPPCEYLSQNTYVLDDINNAIATSYNVANALGDNVRIYHNTAGGPVRVNGELDFGPILTTSDAPVTFPFYSLLSAASEYNGQTVDIIQDPIGYYYYIQANGGNHPALGASVDPTLVPDSADQNWPILCFMTTQDQMTVNGDGSLSFPSGNSLQLANDLTPLNLGPNGASQTYYFSCNVWDSRGTTEQVTISVEVDQFVPPTIPPCSAPSVCGDPQFAGFLGQSFQVHGVSGQVYNVLSTPSFQYNALFTYLSSGSCRSGTLCFSHPGNYFGEIGMSVKAADGSVSSIRVVAGPVNVGLTVYVNGEVMAVSSSPVQVGSASLVLATPFDLTVEAADYSLKLSNSDMFINQDVSINTPLLRQIQHFKQAVKSANATAAEEIRSVLPHGLLGQTWEYKTYPNRWKYIQGSLFDYSVADGINGKEFKYNRF